MPSGDSQKQVTKQEPWEPQQDFLKDLFSRAQGQVEQGSQVPGFTPDQQQGREMAREQAQSQEGAQQEAISGARDTVQRAVTGDMGPDFDAALQSIIRPAEQQFNENVLPSIRRQAVQGGNLGGSRQGVAEGIAARGFQDQITDAATDLEQQRSQQALQAAFRTPSFEQSAFGTQMQPAQTLQNLGEQERQLEQAILDAPIEDLQRYAQLITGNFGGTTTSPGTESNALLSGLGGAATGASLGAKTGNPWGTGIGAAAGGLAGLFG